VAQQRQAGDGVEDPDPDLPQDERADVDEGAPVGDQASRLDRVRQRQPASDRGNPLWQVGDRDVDPAEDQSGNSTASAPSNSEVDSTRSWSR
jgi:hypothetical protein